eukprot:gb/GECG01006416.1/.p1 GENE.gb/GECG01006416.1/~~gb/GECG01006416.1/.p1  ORF type:complete len:457 (+),score=74.86 gb/GECG01006416.1/:1-1371(+)
MSSVEHPFVELRKLCSSATTTPASDEHERVNGLGQWLEAQGGISVVVEGLLCSEKDMKKTRRRSKKKKKQEQQESVFDTEGQGPIHKAANSGLQQVLEYLLGQIQNYVKAHYEDTTEHKQIWEQIIDARDKSWKTPLMLAAAGGYTRCVDTLVKFGANPNDRKPNGWTALLYACKASSKDVVATLVEHGADTRMRNREKATPLYISAREASEDIVAYLIDKCGSDPQNEATANGRTPLHVSISNSNPNVLPVLLDRANPAQLPNIKDNSGQTLQHEAADVGSIEATQQLERYGFAFWDAGTNIADQFPIQMAVLRAHEDFVRYALGYLSRANGAMEVDMSMQLNKALYDAAAKGVNNVLELLLEHGANPNFQGQRRSTLHTAALGGSSDHLKCVKTLLRHEASPVAVDSENRTPLEATQAFLGELGDNESDPTHRNVDVAYLRETIFILKQQDYTS